MVEPHVAGLAGLRLLRLLLGEGVARMAGITGSQPKATAGLLERLDLLFGLEPDLVTSADCLT